MDWLKLYVEIAFDPKVRSMPENFRWRLVVLMCLHRNGMVPGLTEKQIAIGLGISMKELTKTKVVFVANHFMDESWKLHNWDKRQRGISESRDRTERWRERHRDGNVTSLNGHSDVTCDDRARERREEKIREDPPYPPKGCDDETPIPLPGPEYTAVGELAIQLTGDLSWGRWVSDMGTIRHPAASVRRALELAAGSGNLKKPYVAKILQEWAANGGPPKQAIGPNGECPMPEMTPELEKRLADWEAANAVKRKSKP